MSPRKSFKFDEFVAHGSAVTCLALDHRSGQLMVTGGDDAKINVWSIGRPNCLMSLNGHRTSVECAKFHHNQDLIGVGSASGAIKLWDLKEAKLIQTLIGHKTNVRCLDFHPYGQFMSSGSFDTNIKLWDYRKKGCICTYRAHSKEVHCMKMSPDGRWIASGGNEGNVVIYDIVAGKVIAELKGHGASITDVTFHPEEFLLASSSLDGTVKFWDLEQYQQISSSSYSSDMGPVRKINFHPSGKALCASGRDCLKIFSWEPTKVYDTVKVNWGRPNDVAVLDQQLISCGYSTTNVSVFVVDLANVSPFGNSSSAKSIRDSPLRKSTRKSFTRSDKKFAKILESIDSIDPSDVHSSSSDDLSFAEVHSQDYKTVFKSRRELVRTPPLDSGISSEDVSLIDIPGRVETFEDMFHSPKNNNINNMSKSLSHHSFNSMNGKRTSPTRLTTSDSLNSLNLANRTNSGNMLHQTNINNDNNNNNNNHHNSLHHHMFHHTNIFPSNGTQMNVNCATQLSPIKNKPGSSPSRGTATTKAMSVVKPQVSGTHRIRPCNERSSTAAPSSTTAAASVTVTVPSSTLPVTTTTTTTNNGPTSGYESSSFDFNDFLPKHVLQRDNDSNPNSKTDMQVIDSIMAGNRPIVVGLDYRLKHMQVVLLKFAKDPRFAVEYAISLNEISIVVDLLNVLILKASIWTLDICLQILPSIQDLLESKYESYVNVGCSALSLIVKTFGGTIKANVLRISPGIGVDITREERYNKCQSCYNMLLRSRSFIQERQTVSGATGRVFRHLVTLMETLD